MVFIIRYHGAWVTRVELGAPESKTEFSLGRAAENDIVLSFDFVSRHHAKIYFQHGDWWYQDLRDDHPRYTSDPLKLTSSTIVEIEAGLELLSEDSFRIGETRIHDRRALNRFRFRRKDDKKRFAFGVLMGAMVVGLTYVVFKIWGQAPAYDANAIFGLVRPKVVEFVKIKNEKAIRDFKKYGEMKDEDFVEEMGFCTGFMIAPGTVLTANHCMHGASLVDGAIDFQLKTFDGKIHAPTRILGFDIKKDFLFLEAPTLSEYGHLNISNNDFRVGESVYTVGNVSGEGLAIREGITASKTKDQNDPNIEFVRFSAAASGGNSGGPLVNAQGEVVALVFAATWDGNYNMGSGADYLREAKSKFVDDKSDKKILLEPKRLLNFQPLMIPYQLYLPTLDSAYESPDHFRLFESMNFELQMPNNLPDHYRTMLENLNRSASEKMAEVEARLRKEGFRSKDWSDQVDNEVPMIVFGETSAIFARISLSNKSEDYAIYPQNVSTSMPMGPSAYKAFLQTLRSENLYSYLPEQQSLALRIDEAQIPNEKDSIIYRAGSFTQRESLDRITYEPFGLVLMAKKRPSGGWETARKVDPKKILRTLVADGLIGSSANSFYLRPNARRDFLMKEIDEEVSYYEISDLIGRKWQVFSFLIFGAVTVDTFCLPIPQGVYCQALSFPASEPDLLKILRQNVMRTQLTNRQLPGFFSTVDSIIDFQSKGAEQLPPWNDYEIRKDAGGKLIINLKHFGIQFALPKDDTIESIRLNAALLRGNPAKWVASGYEMILKDPKEKMKRKYCEVSYERKGSLTSSVLATIRAEEQSRERLSRKKKVLEDESSPIWIDQVQSKRTQDALTLYGYCVPAERQGDSEQLLNFNFDLREAYQPTYKTLAASR